MNILFPIMTVLLIMLGAFCLFISMDNRRQRAKISNRERLAYSILFFRKRSRLEIEQR